MIDIELFDDAQLINQRIISVNKTFAQYGFFIDVTLMLGNEEVIDITSTECFQVEQRDKDGMFVTILASSLTESDVWSWLDGYETAMEAPLRAVASHFTALTIPNCKSLMALGFLIDDLAQIEECAKKCKITLNRRNKDTITRKRISRKKAENLLGRETFLPAIGRAAFHASSSRKLDDGSMIMFEYDIWRK